MTATHTKNTESNTAPTIAEVVIEDSRWHECDLPALAKRAFAAVFQCQNISAREWTIAVLATGDARIATLNNAHRNKPSPTNVLSWPSFEITPLQAGKIPPPTGFEDSLGDIALSYDTILRESRQEKMSFDDYVCYLLTHGCLHLLGFDHETDADAQQMQRAEQSALAQLRINHPHGEYHA